MRNRVGARMHQRDRLNVVNDYNEHDLIHEPTALRNLTWDCLKMEQQNAEQARPIYPRAVEHIGPLDDLRSIVACDVYLIAARDILDAYWSPSH